MNLISSYLLGDLKHVKITYEIQSSKNQESFDEPIISVAIKDEVSCGDDQVIIRKLWDGYLYQADSPKLKHTNWLFSSHIEDSSSLSTALPFIRVMEQTISQLQNELQSTQIERDKYEGYSHEWKGNLERFQNDSQKSLDDLTSNFLILYNDTKKQLHQALTELKEEKQKKKQIVVRTVSTGNSKNSQMSSSCAKRTLEGAVDHEDEHDLQIFDEKDVEKYALGLAVAKNSVNPNKGFTSDLPNPIISQSEPKNSQREIEKISRKQESAKYKERNNQLSSLPLDMQSQMSFQSMPASSTNPYTGAVELWDPNAVFSDDNESDGVDDAFHHSEKKDQLRASELKRLKTSDNSPYTSKKQFHSDANKRFKVDDLVCTKAITRDSIKTEKENLPPIPIDLNPHSNQQKEIKDVPLEKFENRKISMKAYTNDKDQSSDDDGSKSSDISEDLL